MNIHRERLHFLKQKGFAPKTIYDIGAFIGEWTHQVKDVFPNSDFYLFEANRGHEFFLKLQPHPYFIELLGNENKEIIFYSRKSTGDSIFRENSSLFMDPAVEEIPLQMKTLASVIQKHQLPLPNFIKIDTQGAEHLILSGSKDEISHAEVILLEMKILEYNQNSPLIFENMQLMNALGYQMSDILEYHYLPSQELNEIDILFIKKGSPLIKTGLMF